MLAFLLVTRASFDRNCEFTRAAEHAARVFFRNSCDEELERYSANSVIDVRASAAHSLSCEQKADAAERTDGVLLLRTGSAAFDQKTKPACGSSQCRNDLGFRDVGSFRRHCKAQAKMLILIVEDEPISALSTIMELEHAGHETLGPAATLEQGLELARTGHPRLALVDIDLVHKGDGVELAKRLRELHIAAVFVSAQGHVAYDNRALALGFIGKPYNPSDLPRSIDVIAAILDGRQPPPPPLPRALQLFN